MYGGDAAGQSMADNLKARGLSGAEVKIFNLGFVTEDLDYYEILKKDFDDEIIKDSAVTSKPLGILVTKIWFFDVPKASLNSPSIVSST